MPFQTIHFVIVKRDLYYPMWYKYFQGKYVYVYYQT